MIKLSNESAAVEQLIKNAVCGERKRRDRGEGGESGEERGSDGMERESGEEIGKKWKGGRERVVNFQ